MLLRDAGPDDLTFRDRFLYILGQSPGGSNLPDLIRSASLTDYVEVARSLGLEPYRMLDAVGLPASCVRDPDIKIPADAVRRLLETSAKAANVDDFGLRLAEKRALSNLGPIALVVREQPTIRKAIEALIRYGRLHSESVALRLEDVDDLVIISPVLKVGRPVPMRQAIELVIGALYRMLRSFLGDAWKAQSISFTHGPPRKRDTHRRVFGIPVEFNRDFNGIVCLAGDLEVPIPAADATMARYAQQYLDSVGSRANVTVSDKVRELIWIMLPTGRCSVEQVAEHLGVDRRTVHRQLARDGETFSAILDAVRTEMVTRYIENRDRPLNVVAEMLGFSALSAFSRWFHGQFGCSVTAWRAANVKAADRDRT
jgi:AraC-like DNA-binding protein